MLLGYNTPTANPGDLEAPRRGRFKAKSTKPTLLFLKDQDFLQERAALRPLIGHAAFDGSGGAAGARRRGGPVGFRRRNFRAFNILRRRMLRGVSWGGGPALGGPKHAGRRAPTCATNMEISLEDAFRGKQATIRVRDLGGLRETCHGSGAGERGLNRSPALPATCMGKVRAGSPKQGTSSPFLRRDAARGWRAAARPGDQGTRAGPAASGSEPERERSPPGSNIGAPRPAVDGTGNAHLSFIDKARGEAGLRGAPPGDLYILSHDHQSRTALFQRGTGQPRLPCSGVPVVPTPDENRAGASAAPIEVATTYHRTRHRALKRVSNPAAGTQSRGAVSPAP